MAAPPLPPQVNNDLTPIKAVLEEKLKGALQCSEPMKSKPSL